MRLCVLYSGGKDSNLALLKAVESGHEIACLLSLKPVSAESEVFHFPNVELTEMQAEAIGVPLISVECGDREDESLKALREGLERAKELGAEGVVTGAIRSTYQASRFQRICYSLDLWCFNPLWLRDEVSILREVVERGFETVIVRVAGIDRRFLGANLKDVLRELSEMKGYANPAGEGGEYETLVLDMPLFRKRIVIEEFEVVGGTGEDEDVRGAMGVMDAVMVVKKARLVPKR